MITSWRSHKIYWYRKDSWSYEENKQTNSIKVDLSKVYGRSGFSMKYFKDNHEDLRKKERKISFKFNSKYEEEKREQEIIRKNKK